MKKRTAIPSTALRKAIPLYALRHQPLLHGLDVPQVYHANTLLHDVLDYTEGDKVDVILMNPLRRQRKGRCEKSLSHRFGQQRNRRPVHVGDYVPTQKNGRAAVILPDGFCLAPTTPR